MRVLGIMSGTSADGADFVLAELAGLPPRVAHRVLEHISLPYPANLREAVLRALYSQANTREVALLHHDLGRFFAEGAASFAGKAQLAALHGQTVWHQPPAATWQIGEAAYLAEALSCPVVADFRPSDLALGGQAAPLVAYPDLLLYGEEGVRRALHNLGGISNVTYLDGLEASRLLAFDTGPGNCLLDEAAARLGHSHDPAGSLARTGQINQEKLSSWLAHPFFSQPPPKSTGREVWRLDSLATEGMSAYDLLATLTELTAKSIANAYQQFLLPRGLDQVWIGGGGAYNQFLVERIRQALPVPVFTFEEKGLDSRVREALAFAVLGYLRFHQLPNVLSGVTGAKKDAVAGKLVLPGKR